MHRPDEALNAVCPYYTMFPLEFPVRVLSRHSHPTKWVLDPFCGRGTTNFAARLLGLPSVGLDSSPIAAARLASHPVGCASRSPWQTDFGKLLPSTSSFPYISITTRRLMMTVER